MFTRKQNLQKNTVSPKYKVRRKHIIRILTYGTLTSLLVIVFAGCGERITPPEKVELEYWGVWNEKSEIQKIITDFNAKYSHISIKYRKLRYEEYQDLLLTGWAQDKGPDIFAIQNSWVGAYKNFIEPMPQSMTVKRKYIKESFAGAKKDEVVEEVKIPGYDARTLNQKFVQVMVDDAVINNQIYGLPLSIDTLAMYYNRDLLSQAQITQPPTLWSEFIEIIPRLTLLDQDGNIIRSGAAMGATQNVDRAVDILANLMLQNGTNIVEEKRVVLTQESATQKGYYPGPRALEFYTDFAVPTKQVYTWNENMPNSLEAFAQGRVAFFFGYAYHLPLVQAQAQGINFDIVKFPQIDTNRTVNFANYWIETVAKKSEHQNEAWAFLQFATDEENVIPFLEKSKKPTALLSLITSQVSENPILSPFIIQGLTAKSWYSGRKPVEAEAALENAIQKILAKDVPEEGDPYAKVLQDVAKKIQGTL
ncbi:MAG: hypothetical protein A3B74_03135 [Candidatus Kerfeldbacteria bacterium RIFCSPHIGHO2_02_FULL_42_14]|uniref:ABC transporter substrate-binding protein n=1 Tax=Candidatus Kerfeldbacteria bacterium RIFCSPHIGHO2_02_FULL_42_14 TaxID=1798540 RepID=A0A1G2ARY5_9BACT|nr:MAG: hypothetical protein A3B74_03135 [Candidatus Kerfeldbacteria bacterium RIFCSPHIGHO2_02_FULL_42_14]OGY80902.1 MAG: hypothetical protein A3E60_03050 [Candidatus Kerfeldbacteria bacterium RIFCSPHIGHO2_12_FULL_42_13]OGY84135.1 MAG: hypothetical protein A3I91_01450 [Candidatus Kerfeldbacteria bacterium RIFCSPLOWO2_02_FULL_42_19]OGY87265.1 MAG: hypothetical protein A3G01_02920 [Candidatus Kerfeldbacteria bacterium RIFCSPLOWO2_12_FULL_43_9]